MNRPVRPLLHLRTTGVALDTAARGSTLIHAGHLGESDRAVQAQTVQRHLQRIAPQARIIVIAAAKPPPYRHGAGLTPLFVSRPRADVLCAAHLARHRLLVPGHNETFGDIFLQALASGVPLDTVNYYLPEPSDFHRTLRIGDVFIRIRSRETARHCALSHPMPDYAWPARPAEAVDHRPG